VTFSDMVTYFRARFGVEEGQTMAEYGVVLAVITALVVAAILALSGAIAGASGQGAELPVSQTANDRPKELHRDAAQRKANRTGPHVSLA